MEGSDLKPANTFGLGFTFDDLEPLPLIADTNGPESNLSWDAVVSAVEPDVLADFKGVHPTYPDMDLSALQRDKATSSSSNSLDAAGTVNGLLVRLQGCSASQTAGLPLPVQNLNCTHLCTPMSLREAGKGGMQQESGQRSGFVRVTTLALDDLSCMS